MHNELSKEHLLEQSLPTRRAVLAPNTFVLRLHRPRQAAAQSCDYGSHASTRPRAPGLVRTPDRRLSSGFKERLMPSPKLKALLPEGEVNSLGISVSGQLVGPRTPALPELRPNSRLRYAATKFRKLSPHELKLTVNKEVLLEKRQHVWITHSHSRYASLKRRRRLES